jgi:hypothetical protein
MLKYSRRNACFKHSILFTVNEAAPAPDNLMPVTLTTKMEIKFKQYAKPRGLRIDN